MRWGSGGGDWEGAGVEEDGCRARESVNAWPNDHLFHLPTQVSAQRLRDTREFHENGRNTRIELFLEPGQQAGRRCLGCRTGYATVEAQAHRRLPPSSLLVRRRYSQPLETTRRKARGRSVTASLAGCQLCSALAHNDTTAEARNSAAKLLQEVHVDRSRDKDGKA